MQHPAEESLLGKQTDYVTQYDTSLLFPIERRFKWQEFGIDENNLPYQGVDIWNAYELSWLLPSGKPVVAVAEIRVPAESPNIIESKSFKLYLNSLNQSQFASFAEVQAVMSRDLTAIAGAPVQVWIKTLAQAATEAVVELPGICIDEQDIAISQYDQPNASLLQCRPSKQVKESLHTHLLRSSCPVTGQPDWGSLCVEYQGAALCHASLLAYVISFRQHQDFHEQCVERIFLDLYQLLKPQKLTVFARYLRRGGLDINPYRSTHSLELANTRLVRQ